MNLALLYKPSHVEVDLNDEVVLPRTRRQIQSDFLQDRFSLVSFDFHVDSGLLFESSLHRLNCMKRRIVLANQADGLAAVRLCRLAEGPRLSRRSSLAASRPLQEARGWSANAARPQWRAPRRPPRAPMIQVLLVIVVCLPVAEPTESASTHLRDNRSYEYT